MVARQTVDRSSVNHRVHSVHAGNRVVNDQAENGLVINHNMHLDQDFENESLSVGIMDVLFAFLFHHI